MIGLSLLLPDVIMVYISPDLGPLYWPFQLYMIVIGSVFLAVRYSFAKRGKRAALIMGKLVAARWICSYCGKSNMPGSTECASCGAPIKFA